jgi:Na+/H+ antiporter NhaA
MATVLHAQRGLEASAILVSMTTPDVTVQATTSTGRTAWARNLAAPVRDFLNNEAGSALVLLAAAVLAMLWANSPWPDSYESVWTTKLSINLGDAGISLDLRHWVNQGLMTFFFLVVGLEAKRELDVGELRERRRLTIPALAAVGGIAVPVLIFLAFNAGGSGANGWGAAMSTDTAFALGVLALVAPGGTRLRVAMLTFAIFDDVAALLVIAIAYTSGIDWMALAVAAALFGVLFVLRFADGLWRRPAALGLGVAAWVALLESGVDPVITGLAVGLVTAAYPPSRGDLEEVTDLTRSFREQPTAELARSAQLRVLSAISPNERIQYRLHPWTSFVIVPLFALANIGTHVNGGLLSDAVRSPITLGIVVGYVVGKPIGIIGAAWLASRPWLLGARRTLSWPVLTGGAAAAGVGFTVSLLISSIAFEGRELEEAKLGVVGAAVIASGLAWTVFAIIKRLPSDLRARQISQTTPETLVDLSTDVDTARDHIRGPLEASVTLVEYGDYQCPYCGMAEGAIHELLDSVEDVRYVWRHLPLNDVHPQAQFAAEATEAAAAQGAFWEMHDKLFQDQDDLLPGTLLRYAKELGLDVDRFHEDLTRHEYAWRITEDVASADESGVAGTPTFFINGRRHAGAYDVDSLRGAVDRARSRARMIAKAA